MPFQPLTEEQFNKAKSAGFSTEQIIGFEKQRKAKESGVGEIVGRNLMSALKGTGESAGVAANTALMGIPGAVSQLATGGQLVNPMTHGLNVVSGGKNVFAGEDLTGGQRMMAEGMGMVAPVGGAMKLAGKGLSEIPIIKNVLKYSKPKAQANLAEEVQNTLLSQKRNVIDKYGKEYEETIGKSKNKVSLNNPIKNFVDESQGLMQNPEFIQQVAVKNPQAMRIFDIVKKVTDAKVPEEISAKEADNLQKFIRNLPSIKTKLSQGSKYGFHTVQWTNEDRMLIGLADDIKSAVIEAHPDLLGLNKEYGSFMNAYRKVSPDFKVGTTVNKLKNYHTIDPQKKMLFESIMPDKTIQKIKDFNKADLTSQLLKKLGLGGAKALGAGGLAAAGFETAKHLMGE